MKFAVEKFVNFVKFTFESDHTGTTTQMCTLLHCMSMGRQQGKSDIMSL